MPVPMETENQDGEKFRTMRRQPTLFGQCYFFPKCQLRSEEGLLTSYLLCIWKPLVSPELALDGVGACSAVPLDRERATTGSRCTAGIDVVKAGLSLAPWESWSPSELSIAAEYDRAGC